MIRRRKKNWRLVATVVVMLAALAAYVLSLDESDPEALSEAVDGVAAAPE